MRARLGPNLLGSWRRGFASKTSEASGRHRRGPCGLRTRQKFFESLVATRERVALMAGRTWDASTRLAVSGGSVVPGRARRRLMGYGC